MSFVSLKLNLLFNGFITRLANFVPRRNKWKSCGKIQKLLVQNIWTLIKQACLFIPRPTGKCGNRRFQETLFLKAAYKMAKETAQAKPGQSYEKRVWIWQCAAHSNTDWLTYLLFLSGFEESHGWRCTLTESGEGIVQRIEQDQHHQKKYEDSGSFTSSQTELIGANFWKRK